MSFFYLQALRKLQKKEKVYEVTAEGADGYVSFYKKFGSHFVSSVKFGDVIFQVC